jgi:hypothetical protein
MKKIGQYIGRVGEKEQPEKKQQNKDEFRFPDCRPPFCKCRKPPGNKGQKQIPVQKKKTPAARIKASEYGKANAQKRRNSHKNRFIQMIRFS